MNKSNSNVGIKTDCFAYRPERMNPCSALDDLYCKCEVCSFYKTKEQFDDEIKKYGWFHKQQKEPF